MGQVTRVSYGSDFFNSELGVEMTFQSCNMRIREKNEKLKRCQG